MKASSERMPPGLQGAAASAGASRIIAAGEQWGMAKFPMHELAATSGPAPTLGPRDANNEVARAAYALGRQRGYEQGAREGLRQGYSEGSQALEEFESRKAADVARQLQSLADAFRGELAVLETQVASDLVSLAIDIARQVLRRELQTSADGLLPVATEALRALGEGASQLELRVNPQDAGMLRQQLTGQPGARAWHIAADPSITRGGLRVEADTGVADATFEARWQAVMAALGRDEEPLP